MRNHLLKSLLVLTIGAFTFSSCDKDSEAKHVSEIESDLNIEIGDYIDNDVTNIGNSVDQDLFKLGKTQDSRQKFYGDCAEINREVLGSGVKVTIDFGDGCEDNKGNIRSGKIFIVKSFNRETRSTLFHYTFSNYHYNNNKVVGGKTIRRVVKAEDTGLPTAFKKSEFRILLADDEGWISHSRNVKREWLEGFRSGNWDDNVIRITGKAWGKNLKGENYRMEIIEPIIAKTSCSEGRYVQGVKNRTFKNREVVIDYGDGTCDDEFTVSVNGEEKTRYWSNLKNRFKEMTQVK